MARAIDTAQWAWTRLPLGCSLAGSTSASAVVSGARASSFALSRGIRCRPAMCALLPRLARKVGIEKRVHPHGLRHTCAAELAMERVPVHVIRKQLGHASLHTTTVFLEHIAPVELADTMRRR